MQDSLVLIRSFNDSCLASLGAYHVPSGIGAKAVGIPDLRNMHINRDILLKPTGPRKAGVVMSHSPAQRVQYRSRTNGLSVPLRNIRRARHPEIITHGVLYSDAGIDWRSFDVMHFVQCDARAPNNDGYTGRVEHARWLGSAWGS